MLRSGLVGLTLYLFAFTASAQAPSPKPFEGTAVLMSATADLEVPNDEGLASFYLELQDADLARAQSLLNQRVGRGIEALKKADAKGEVQSSGYQAQPIYEHKGERRLVGWRVRQSVTLKTAELSKLPQTVAAAQKELALGGIDFRVAKATRERLEGELIQSAIANLQSKVASAARALEVPPERIRIEELNFGVAEPPRPLVMHARAQMAAAESIEPPQFEPGKSTQQVHVNARVRFLNP